MATNVSFETQVKDLARAITDAGASERTKVFKMSWASERMLDWAMANPDFKTQLFRFVDVFPACRNDADTMRHLSEYLDGPNIPSLMEFGLSTAEHIPLGGRITGAIARRNIIKMAQQFIPGSTPAEALPKLKTLWRLGEASTVDLLGEKTVTPAEADRYAKRVLEMLEALAAGSANWPDDPQLEKDPWGDVPRVNVSVKPTALSPLFNPMTDKAGIEDAYNRLRPTLEAAKRLGGTVHLDTEHYDVKDVTYDLLRRIGTDYPDGPQLGCVVQAYLRESHDDLVTLIDWSRRNLQVPLQIRLVKGAYWDYETIHAQAEGWPVPVYENKEHTDANYEHCVDTMLDAAGEIRPAFASHNIRSLAYAIAATRSRGLHDTSMELQLLYGMAEPVHAALRKFGLRVRVYAPVGELVPGMAYLVRRLLENTSNESFIRHRFAEGKALDALIAEPSAKRMPGPPDPVLPPPVTDADKPSVFDNEPPTEFRRERNRERMRYCVDAASEGFGFEVPIVIGGEHRRGDGEIISTDPGDYKTVICRSAKATIADADLAVEVARAGFAKWRATPASERAAVLFRAADAMRRRKLELAALAVFEAGKPWVEADADIAEAIDFCEYYGREAIRLSHGLPILQAPGETNTYRYQPRGVAVVIAPWNFPLAIPAGMVTAALAAGNAVILKPAEQTPGVAYRLVEILWESGVPPQALGFLPGLGEEVGAHLVAHADVDIIVFTGSKAVGLDIVRQAGIHAPGQNHIKRVVAELGGKNAIIVDTDADLDQAVPAAIASAFSYAGQKCSAAARIIGVGAIFDDLVDRLRGSTAIVPVGHARHQSTFTGPLIDEDSFKRLHRYRDLAASEGEIVIARDDVPDGGWYVGPTVAITNDPNSRTATEEVFGPLAVVIRANDFDHALHIANSTPYALTGGLFSRSPSRIAHAAENFRAGNLYINRSITGALVGRQPFGGFGMSGVGSKAGGPDYMLQFVEPRVVTENTIRQGFAPTEP